MRTRHRTGRTAAVLALLTGSLLGTSILAPPAQAAMSFSKSVDKATVAPGETVTYTLRYTCSVTECNGGKITDTLPSNMEFVGWTPDPSTVDEANSTVPAAGSKGGTMDIALKSLAPGTTATITVSMKYPNFSTPNGTASTNSATMSATGEPSRTGTADTTAQVTPEYTVTKGVQTSSKDGRTVTFQFSTCAEDQVPNVDLSTSRLLDTLPAGAVVDTGRSPGWSQVAPGPNTWGYDIGEFTSGNGRGGCRTPGVLVVNFPESSFPDGSTANNTVDLLGAPLGESERKLDDADATTGQFQPPVTGVDVTASKVWRDEVTAGDINSFSLSATNTSGPATSLTITDPGAGTTEGLYNWIFPQSIQLEAWNPNSVQLTLKYRLNGDPTWLTFTPGSPFNGAANRRITFAEGVGDPANDILGIPAGRWLDGLQLTWDGPIPTGWSPGNAVQLVTQVSDIGHDGRMATNPLTNCVDTTATDGTTNASANACASTTIKAGTNLGAAKTTVAGAVTSPGGKVTFQVIPYNRSAHPLDRPLVLYDVLPAGLVYVEGSARPDPNYADAKAPSSVTVTPGPDGRQVVRMEWPAGVPDMMYLKDALAYRMLFDATVAGSVRGGTLTNDLYVGVDGPTRPVTCMFSGSDSSTPDTLDLNGNGDTTERLCRDRSEVQVQVPAVLRSYKEVKGDLDPDYAAIGSTTPGGHSSWRMTVRNDSPDPVTEFIAYDKLPTPGDNYVLTQGAKRDSAWTPSLSEAIKASDPTVLIEYTTDANPCIESKLGDRDGCNASAAWTTDFPGPGVATWFRIHRPGAMAPGDSFTLTWPMVAPFNAPDGEYAWNSFAYTATDSSSRQLLPAEPAKVGVALKRTTEPNNSIGDFVWVDADDSGIQKDGVTPVAGVRVNLLDEQGQPVRDLNGKPVTAVTDANGKYLFDKLPDGTYQVQFDLSTLPAGSTVSKQSQGSDVSKQSSADPATGLTRKVTVTGGQSNLDLDMGIVQAPKNDNAIGDFVWIDADDSGVQKGGDTPVQGVKVNLLDGNGQPVLDAGGQPVTTTTGADGKYLFDNLPNGTYQVEFDLTTLPPGAKVSKRAQGSDVTKQSSADPATGRTQSVTLSGGQRVLDLDMGIVEAPKNNNAIGDFVWLDKDKSGVQKGGDTPVQGVKVNLLDGNGRPVLDAGGQPVSAVTDADGKYLFDNLPDGSYQVEFDLTTLPAGTEVTTQGQGSDVAKQSSADPATGRTRTVTVTGGQRNLDLDMGLVEKPEPSPSPSPEPSPSPSPSEPPGPSSTPSPSESPAPSPSESPTQSPSESPVVSPSPTPSHSPSTGQSMTTEPLPPQSPPAGNGHLPDTGSPVPGVLLGLLSAIAVLGGLVICTVAYRRSGRHS